MLGISLYVFLCLCSCIYILVQLLIWEKPFRFKILVIENELFTWALLVLNADSSLVCILSPVSLGCSWFHISTQLIDLVGPSTWIQTTTCAHGLYTQTHCTTGLMSHSLNKQNKMIAFSSKWLCKLFSPLDLQDTHTHTHPPLGRVWLCLTITWISFSVNFATRAMPSS